MSFSSPLPNAEEGPGVRGPAYSGIFSQVFQASHRALGFSTLSLIRHSNFGIRHFLASGPS